MRRGGLLAAVGLMLLAAVWGAVFLLKPQEAPVKLEVISLSGEDGEADPVLLPGELAQGGVAFRNSGQAGCSLRIRLCTAQLGGKPVLEAGNLEAGNFVEAGVQGEKSPDGWIRRGEYLCYQNNRTEDILLPGRETPPAYSAVRMNPVLEEEDLEALRLMGEEQQLFILVEAETK